MSRHDFLDADLTWPSEGDPGSTRTRSLQPVGAAAEGPFTRITRRCHIQGCRGSGSVPGSSGTSVIRGAAESGDGQKVDLAGLDGPLSFGHFLEVARDLARAPVAHPVKPLLAAGRVPQR